MNWTALTDVTQLDKINSESGSQPFVIFKHSKRCSISRATLDRLERNWREEELPTVKTYLLDLLTYRDISNQIAEAYEVEHESPQVLVIQNGKAIFNRSHFEIDFSTIKNVVEKFDPVQKLNVTD